MRFATYGFRGSSGAGVVAGSDVVDVRRAALWHRAQTSSGWDDSDLIAAESVRTLLGRFTGDLAPVEELVGAVQQAAADDRDRFVRDGIVFALDEVRLGPPVTDPQKIICLGRNYLAHADEAGMEPPPAPELFSKFNNTLIGHEDAIVLPSSVTQEVDYEAELAVVIGKPTHYVTAAEAANYIGGYTIMHDVSARDYQLRTSQWLAGKSCDTFGPCGPWIVTPDEAGDPRNLSIKLTLNDEVMQDANTSRMIFSVFEAVAYASQAMTLLPGDIISTGTPEGVGLFREPPRYLREGDVTHIDIEGIGRLSNPVVNEKNV